MRERGIIFNDEMVRAVLEGRKTQTRRIMKVQPVTPELELSWIVESTRRAEDGKFFWREPGSFVNNRRSVLFSCPFGAVGDRLWVRETWSDVNHEGWAALAYRADGKVRCLNEDDGDESDPNCEKYKFANWYPDLISGKEGRWRPSIHMPRWASRIKLEITGVRVERLNSISEADAKAEGLAEITKDGSLFKFGIPDRDGYPGTDDKGWPWTEWERNPVDAYCKLWQSIYGDESWQANPLVWVIEFKRLGVNDV